MATVSTRHAPPNHASTELKHVVDFEEFTAGMLLGGACLLETVDILTIKIFLY